MMHRRRDTHEDTSRPSEHHEHKNKKRVHTWSFWSKGVDPQRTISGSAMEAGVVREWLDGVHSGYGDRFTPALEEYGVEDLQDLALLATTDKDELDKIFTDAGAKKMHILNIHKGIALLTSAVPSPAPPELPAPGNFTSSIAICL